MRFVDFFKKLKYKRNDDETIGYGWYFVFVRVDSCIFNCNDCRTRFYGKRHNVFFIIDYFINALCFTLIIVNQIGFR